MESTLSSEQSHAERQSMVDFYVGRMVRHVAANPLDSTAQIMENAIHEGPLWDKKEILQLFKGVNISKQTCQRMEVIRRAALEQNLPSIPVELRWEPYPDIEPLEPPYQDFSQWWSPQLYGYRLFYNTIPAQEPLVPRYPSRCNTDEYFASDLEEEAESSTMGEADPHLGLGGGQRRAIGKHG